MAAAYQPQQPLQRGLGRRAPASRPLPPAALRLPLRTSGGHRCAALLSSLSSLADVPLNPELVTRAALEGWHRWTLPFGSTSIIQRETRGARTGACPNPGRRP
jgi:hypothetical protein